MEKGHQRTKLKVQLAIGMLRIGSAENCCYYVHVCTMRQRYANISFMEKSRL